VSRLDALLEPGLVIGSGGYTPATSRMEVGSLASEAVSPAAMRSSASASDLFSEGATNWGSVVFALGLGLGATSSQYVLRVADPLLYQRGGLDYLADYVEFRTAQLSVIKRASGHSAFRQLMRLGPRGVALALRRLQGTHRPLWLYFLQNTVDSGPPDVGSSINDAARAWRRWGKDRGLL